MISGALLLLGMGGNPEMQDAKAVVALAEKVIASVPQPQWVMKRSGKWLAMKKPTDHLVRDQWDLKVSMLASILHRKGQFTFVEITKSSPSGDWMETHSHVFYPSGQLARVALSYQRIDYGGQAVTRWFGRTGKPLLREEQSFSGSGEEDNSPRAVEISKEFKMGSAPYFSHVNKIPFKNLIKL
jgi:hypothetical protein